MAAAAGVHFKWQCLSIHMEIQNKNTFQFSNLKYIAAVVKYHKVFQRLQRKTNDKFACYLPYKHQILNIVFMFWLFDDYWKNLTSTVDLEKWKVASEKKS